MAIITDAVSERLKDEGAEVFFVSGAATKWWNAKRTDRQTEIALLGGYYWTYKGNEAGPFRTPSAAWRDVYYRRVLGEEPPLMDQKDLAAAEKEIQKGEKTLQRKAKPQRNQGRKSMPGDRALRLGRSA